MYRCPMSNVVQVLAHVSIERHVIRWDRLSFCSQITHTWTYA
jgi:hypothetical protein